VLAALFVCMTNEVAKEILALVRALVEGYTRHHKSLKIAHVRMGSVLQIDIEADERDYPFLLGKCVQNLSALKRLCAAFGNFHRGRVPVELAWTPRPRAPQPPLPFVENTKWKARPFRELMEWTLENITEHLPEVLQEDTPDKTNFIVVLTKEAQEDFPRDLCVAFEMIFHRIAIMQGRRAFVSFRAE
jgi:hypothetical protein